MFKRFVTAPPAPGEPSQYENHFLNTQIAQAFPSSAPLSETIIASDVSIRGSIQFSGLLKVEGRFEGDTLSSGTLIAEKSSIIHANLDLEEAIISGIVKGNITVQKKLTLLAGAQIEGNIKAPLLHIEEGVTLNGKVEVSQQSSLSFESEEEDFYNSDQ